MSSLGPSLIGLSGRGCTSPFATTNVTQPHASKWPSRIGRSVLNFAKQFRRGGDSAHGYPDYLMSGALPVGSISTDKTARSPSSFYDFVGTPTQVAGDQRTTSIYPKLWTPSSIPQQYPSESQAQQWRSRYTEGDELPRECYDSRWNLNEEALAMFQPTQSTEARTMQKHYDDRGYPSVPGDWPVWADQSINGTEVGWEDHGAFELQGYGSDFDSRHRDAAQLESLMYQRNSNSRPITDEYLPPGVHIDEIDGQFVTWREV